MKFLKFSLLLLAGLLIFASCGKEKVSPKEDTLEIRTLDPGDVDGTRSAETEREKDEEKDKEDWKICFEFVYPLTYTMPDGSTISGGDEKEIDAAIKTWYKNNPDAKDKYSLIYPVVILWDGETITLNSGEEMRELAFKCKEGKDDDKGEWKPCFNLVYPVTYTMPDGSTVSGNDEKETYAALKAWYEANPDVKKEATLVFPVTIVWDKNDAPLTINNEEEMKGVKERCEGEKDKECFDLVYPITYTLPDGTTISGGGEEVEIAIKEWYDANPDVDQRPILVYPVNIVFEDGSTATLNNEEDLEETKEDCE